jgi:protein SCO1/2
MQCLNITIQNGEIVRDRLDNVENTNVSEDKLTRIGPAPKFVDRI